MFRKRLYFLRIRIVISHNYRHGKPSGNIDETVKLSREQVKNQTTTRSDFINECGKTIYPVKKLRIFNIHLFHNDQVIRSMNL